MDEVRRLRRDMEARFLRDLRDEHIRNRALLKAVRAGAASASDADADPGAGGGASGAPERGA